MKHLVIIDGYGFVFRAYFSMPKLTRKDGKEVGAVFGFTNMLIKLISETDCTHIAIVFDSGSKNFRHEIYPEYKAHRPPAPADLIEQFPLVRQVAHALNILPIELNGFEADDIIATLASKHSDGDCKVTIVSSDKDLMQLVNENVYMYDAVKAKIITTKEVVEKFGVMPSQVRDILSLIGDASDNIPGVKGIGPKTAQDLINKFGHLNNLIAAIPNIEKAAIKQKLLDNLNNLKLSYELVGLEYNVPLDLTFEDLEKREVDFIQLTDFLERNQFRSIIQRAEKVFKTKLHNNSTKITHNHFTESSLQEIPFDKFIESCAECRSVIIFVLLEEIIVSTKNQYSLLPKNEIQKLRNLLKYTHIQIITFNHKSFSKELGFFTSNYEDIQLMSYLVNSSIDSSNINKILMEFLELDQIDGQHHLISSLFKLFEMLKQKLLENKQIYLYYEIEKKVQEVLFNMENNGIKVSEHKLMELSRDFTATLQDIEADIYKATDENFNIGSPKQLSQILFEKLGLPKPKMLKSGYYSTDVDVMDNLSINGFDIADKILNWRHLSKLINTYTESLPKQINSETSRIHSTFIQTLAITGRLSSINPNLQNIPIRSIEGQKIRQAFIAKDGYKLISADYSQIELRVLAHMAKIDSLITAFKHKQDIHAITASEVFNVPLLEITPELRRKAKAVNFGIIYGISAFGLAKQIMCSRSEAKEIINKYFATYPGIKEYMENMHHIARNNGFVSTIMNRKCFIKDINSNNQTLRSFAERLAINAPIQGSAADIIKKAMVTLIPVLSRFDIKLLLQVHDELIFEVHENQVDNTIPIIKNTMEEVIALDIPLIVDIHAGDNWGSLKN